MIPTPPNENLGRIGKYRIVGFCGGGGVGAVYRAEDDFLRRAVAVKVLRPEHRDDPTLRARFLQEVRIGAKLSHPNIVAVFDGGEIRRTRGEDEATEPAVVVPRLDGLALPDGTLYFVQEFLLGPTLSQHLRAAGPLGYREVPTRLGGVFEALAYMHGRGVIHRDLKPANIYLGEVAKVLDLGSAKVGDDAVSLFDGVERTAGSNVPLTTSYRSPESFDDAPVYDRHFDLWALTVTIYQAVTGHLPFGSGANENFPSMYRRLIEGRYTPLREFDPDVPAGVEAFFARAFALQQEARHPSVEAMYDAVREAFAQKRQRSTPSVAEQEAAPPPPAASAPSVPDDSAGAGVVLRPPVSAGMRASWRGRGVMVTTLAVVGVAAATALVLHLTDRRRRGNDEGAAPSTVTASVLPALPAIGSMTDAAVVAPVDAGASHEDGLSVPDRADAFAVTSPHIRPGPLRPRLPASGRDASLPAVPDPSPREDAPRPGRPHERPPQTSPSPEPQEDPCIGAGAPC